MNLPVEVTSALIAAMFGLVSAAFAFAGKVWLDRRKAAREQRHIHDRAMREDTGKIVSSVIESSGATQEQALQVMKEMLEIARQEAKAHRREAAEWRRKTEEWAKQAEQNRLEYEAMKRALDEEQRRTSELETKVARLERKLREEQEHRRVLQHREFERYVKTPSVPAGPPEDGSEDETPREGKRSMNGE